jgi:F420-dependent methylenetetrahydromethanopterin dehydrogenase
MSQSDSDLSVRALLNTHDKGLPVVLVADDNYRKFPYNIKTHGMGYVVLGAYIIIRAWRKCLNPNDEDLLELIMN